MDASEFAGAATEFAVFGGRLQVTGPVIQAYAAFSWRRTSSGKRKSKEEETD